jgi:outer membrane protein assembly factor BamA
MANLELRFPFVDELLFPIGPIRNIRGFLFLDTGTAWLPNDEFYDPDSFFVRPGVPFNWIDNKNDRLQDLRASYGAGFQFFFLGGLQFNWVWAKRMEYTRYIDGDPTTLAFEPLAVKANPGGVRSEFYIAFDW